MTQRGRPQTPIGIRLLAKIDIEVGSGCWRWTGAKVPQGYGLIKRKDGAQLRAHRVAYELAVGPIPTGMFICHRCDKPDCVRPSHLFVGTHMDNMADMVTKGRAARMQGQRNGCAKLNPDEVESIRLDVAPNLILAQRFGVSAAAVGMIKRRQRWTHL